MLTGFAALAIRLEVFDKRRGCMEKTDHRNRGLPKLLWRSERHQLID